MAEEVGGYVLLEVVGSGSQGTVWRARSTGRAGRIVAVKRVHADASDEAVARLQREAEVLAGLEHPSIVAVVEVVEDPDGGIALVQPYAPGGSLEQVLARRGRLPWPEAADVGAQLASALSSAHAAGVLHRDVKPANVLLGAEAEPRLADFGTVALLAGGHLVDDGVVLGTPEYVDPDVAGDGAPPSPRSDQYSLGVLLYRLLSGQLPHAGGSAAATVAAADRGVHAPLGERTDAPDEVVEAVERSFARRPEDRFGSVQQLGSVLAAAARSAEDDHLRALAAGAPEEHDPDDGRPHVPGLHEHPEDRHPGEAMPVALTAAQAAAVDRGTRRFGPRPATDRDGAPARRRPRWAIPAMVAVVLVPLLLAGGLWLSGRGGGTPDPAATAAPTPREAPSPCEDADAPTAGQEVLEADVDGRGCSLPLVVTEEVVEGEPTMVLAIPDAAGEVAGRYAVADGGDQVIVGDWDCDGTETPGVYRPADGAVYLYSGYGALEPEPAPSLEPGGRVHVVTTDDCDHVVRR